MYNRRMTIAGTTMLVFIALSLSCSAIQIGLGGTPSTQLLPTLTATNTRIPRQSIDFNATVLAATIQAEGGYIVTSTPVPVWPTATPTPFNEASFLATINAQFAQATETALALATPTFIPSPIPIVTPRPPIILPPSGGSAPGIP